MLSGEWSESDSDGDNEDCAIDPGSPVDASQYVQVNFIQVLLCSVVWHVLLCSVYSGAAVQCGTCPPLCLVVLTVSRACSHAALLASYHMLSWCIPSHPLLPYVPHYVPPLHLPALLCITP